MKRSWLLLGVAAFAVVEALAILYAVWPALNRKEIVHLPELRLGVVSIPPLDHAEKEWESFAETFGKNYKCSLRPYFANSDEEAASALLNGSLDLIYTDTAGLMELNAKAKVKVWFYHRLSKRERERLRSVLVCAKPISYISESKGMRITFSGANSMTGHAVPTRYLEEKLPAKIQDWFSSVSTASSEKEAFHSLLAGETDIVAACDLDLDDDIEGNGASEDGLKRLWVSMPLPENVLCSRENLPENLAERLADASAKIMTLKLREEFLYARSMVFLPPDHSFLDLRNSLQRFLEGPRAAKSKTPVSKEPN